MPKTTAVHVVELKHTPGIEALSGEWGRILRARGFSKNYWFRRPGLRLLLDAGRAGANPQLVVAPGGAARYLREKAPDRFTLVQPGKPQTRAKRKTSVTGVAAIAALATLLAGLATIKLPKRATLKTATTVPRALMQAERYRSKDNLGHFHTWAALGFIRQALKQTELPVETLKDVERLAKELDVHPLTVLHAYADGDKATATDAAGRKALERVRSMDDYNGGMYADMRKRLRDARLKTAHLKSLGNYLDKPYGYNLATEEWPAMFK
ncbi:MAG: hypothetical protein AABW54_03270 [Candidatus Micrarchaeota archaeon]